MHLFYQLANKMRVKLWEVAVVVVDRWKSNLISITHLEKYPRNAMQFLYIYYKYHFYSRKLLDADMAQRGNLVSQFEYALQW